MEKDASQDKTARALRIYEYEDQDGVVFWSFTLLPHHSHRRLNIVEVRGTHYRTHLSDIQRSAFQREILDKDD